MEAVAQIGGRADPLLIEPPASEYEIRAIEQSLGLRLPVSLRQALLLFSRKVRFRWFLPKGFELSPELRQVFSGDCHWSPEWLIQFNSDKEGWIREVFPDPNDPYDAVWHGKLAFHEVGNGDYLAIDTAEGSGGAVVYLSHDDGSGHGMQIAANFQDFLVRWTRLGCVGGEDWQWLPFVAPSGGYLDPNCPNARSFRRLLSLQI